MKDSNTRHFRAPTDHALRLVCVNSDATKKRTHRIGWYDTVNRRWFHIGGDEMMVPHYWHHLPEITEG